ncbi:MAG: Eco57I restriction-modification methylase domain-containing protein, partial [Deltaproteobacteria bacterium]|nr:Eco57I restriction-modification methylase domain-containing protein [Deltaproteobacteria bacterium]
MPQRDRQQSVLTLLKDLRGIEPLKELFWSELNYERVNEPLSRRTWTDTAAQALAEDPVLFAGGGTSNDFHVIYARLASNQLLLGQERPVVSRLLRDHPYALFVFSNATQDRWHFLNVKYDEKSDKRRLFRRITVGPGERLRTASERMAMLDLESIHPDLFGLPPLAVQQRCDEAFDVEAVTKQFFDEYKAVFGILQDDLARQTKDRTWAHDYALQFLNRCMFLYYVQRKRWLGEDTDFLQSFWESYKSADQEKDSFFDRWLNVLFFVAFNDKFHGGHRHFTDQIKRALAMAPYLNGGLFTENALDQKYTFKIFDSRFEQVLTFLQRYNFTIAEDSPLDQEVAVDPEMIGKVYESLVNVSAEADERGDAGIFYTPRTEIDLMCRLAVVDHLINHLGQEHKNLLYEAVFALEPNEKTAADKALAEVKLWPDLDARLRELTAVDPACGSGSFLVGMLHIMNDLQERASQQFDKYESSFDRKKRIIGQNLYGVDVMNWACHVAELRLWLALIIDAEFTREELHVRREPLLPHFTFKIRCGDSLVQELGGINLAHIRGSRDIPSALKARITKLKTEKLKFYNNDRTCHFRSVDQAVQEELQLFRDILDARHHNIQERIKTLRRKIEGPQEQQMRLDGTIEERPHQMKLEAVEWQKQVEALTKELDQISDARIALKTAKDVPFVWDIAFVEIFEGDKEGFDIVIGNPPYVRNESIAPPSKPREEQSKAERTAYKQALARQVYEAFPTFFAYSHAKEKAAHPIDLSADLYVYFYFVGLSLLNEKGSLCFITSNSWLDVAYGTDLQEFLLKNSHIKMIIDNQAKRSFATADINTVITLFSSPTYKLNGNSGRSARFVMFKVPFEHVISPVVFMEIEEVTAAKTTLEYRVIPVSQQELLKEGILDPSAGAHKTSLGDEWIEAGVYEMGKWGGKYLRAPDIYFEILEKARTKLVRLGDIAIVDSGINTRANDFFYVKRILEEEWLNRPIENFAGRKVPPGCCVAESWVGRFKKTAKARNPFWPTRWLIEERYLRPTITSP